MRKNFLRNTLNRDKNELQLTKAGLVDGNLLSLFIHRFDSGYSSVGASGAVLAVMFSSIALLPGMKIGLFLLPVSLTGLS